MRVFKNGWFRRYAEREHISDAALKEAIVRAREGLIDANLGGGLIKQRIARSGQGRSSGFRSVIVYRQGEVAFFVFGFAKNSVDNLNVVELREFRKMASYLLTLDDSQIDELMRCGQIEEVK